MGYVKVTFMDTASGQRRERTLSMEWFKGRDALRRDALRILSTWRGVSDPRVVATLTTGDKDWVPEPDAEKTDD